jgi:2-polyprenyl-6-methoxyphenol hydroxylase-like FAD-dependent oxidoreductase
MTSGVIGERAVVIGASMGGLAAAGALAPHFERVVVLEQGALASQPTHRAGTPQGLHTQIIQMSGLLALDQLFPGFEADLARAGAVPIKVGLDLRIDRFPYDPFPRRDLGYVNYAASRPTFQHTVRSRLEGLANTILRHHCRVLELMAAPGSTRVTGVRYENPEGTIETLPADLVIDASGRGAPTLTFLQSIGRPLLEETTIGIDLHYSSCLFDTLSDAPTDWKGVMTLAKAPDSRGGAMFPFEGNRWFVTMVGRHGVAMPSDYDSFLGYAQALRTPTIYNAIKGAKPFSEVECYAFPESARRHFERLDNFPQGLLPLGDAICRFTPPVGHGISVAAQEACVLHRVLDRLSGESDPIALLGPAFFAGIQPLLEESWAVAMRDFVYPQTRGTRPADFEATLKFGAALDRLAADDAAIHKLTTEVQHLLKPRSVFRDPELVRRVMAEMAKM